MFVSGCLFRRVLPRYKCLSTQGFPSFEKKNARWIEWNSEGGSKEGQRNRLELISSTNATSNDHDGKNTAHAHVVGDNTRASDAAKILLQQTYLVYEGDYHNARQLLTALKSRVLPPLTLNPSDPINDQWMCQRSWTKKQARRLNRLLVKVEQDRSLSSYKRAPNQVKEVLSESAASNNTRYLLPLRELLGRLGSNQWSTKGIPLPQLGGKCIFPKFGVFVPTRQEYLDLIVKAAESLDKNLKGKTILDVGTGTGVLLAVLLHNLNLGRCNNNINIIGTDLNPQAIACARDNLERLQLLDGLSSISLLQADLFPPKENKFDLILCNPPWVPDNSTCASATTSWMDRAVYDPNSQFLKAFLLQAGGYLIDDQSEAWLILSDLAELLELRSREQVIEWIENGDLEIMAVSETKPIHKKARNGKSGDAIAAARAAETTRLYRLRKKKAR